MFYLFSNLITEFVIYINLFNKYTPVTDNNLH